MRRQDAPAPVAHVAGSGASLAEVALDLVSFDTRNPPGETRETIEWIEGYLDDLGLETERHAVDPAKPNLLATIPGEGDRTLCLNGHLDTVPFDADEWTHDPLGERVPAGVDRTGSGEATARRDGNVPDDGDAAAERGDRIYGRGATDMKGAVASMLAAARAYVETDTTPPVNVGLAFVSEEENAGDAGMTALLEAGTVDADACVVGEATGGPDRPSVAVADRGNIWLTMEATGTAAHGSRPMFGENAIDRLYEGVRTLRERFGSRPLDLDEAVAPIVEESIEYYAEELGEESARDLFYRPTINLGTIEGGEAINSVPATARAEVDVRLSPGTDSRAVLAAIRACADDCEGVTLADVSWSLGTFVSMDEPVVEAVSSVASSVTGERVYRRSATGGGDAKGLRRRGIPAVEFALSTDTAHAVDEYTTVGMLADNARIYAELPYAFAERLD